MRYYEFMFILRTDLEQEKKSEILGKIAEVLGRNGFSIVKENHMGVQKLAYEIQKMSNGEYYLYYLKTEDHKGIQEVRNYLNMVQDILRYIFIKKEKLDAEMEA